MARIAFCQDVLVEYMGYMCMSAVLKEAGNTVELFFDDQVNESQFINKLKKFKPDIVGFSLLTPTVPWALRIARKVKREIGAVTIFGNVHAMIAPQQIIEEDGVDIVCLGEGELLLKALASCIDRWESYNHIEGFWIKTASGVIKNPLPKAVLDLDQMPFHDRSLYDKYFYFRHSKYLRFSNGKGCPYRCAFCTNAFVVTHFGGKSYIRKRRVNLLIQELESLVKMRKPDRILFIDEIFWIDNDWMRDFLTLYKKKIGLPFTASFRWGSNISENDFRLLKEAGLKALIVAVESADEKQRMQLLDKPVTDKEVFKAAESLHKYKIDFIVNSFFGLPGDTVDSHIRRLDFFRKLKPTYLWTTFFQPYPGIRLTQSSEIKQYIPEAKVFEPTLHHDMYLNLPDKNALVNLKKIYFLLLLWPRIIPIFLRLIRYNIGLFFDILFVFHFSFYVFRSEHLSLLQYLYHIKVFSTKVFSRKKNFKPLYK